MYSLNKNDIEVDYKLNSQYYSYNMQKKMMKKNLHSNKTINKFGTSAQQLVGWTYIKELFTETPVDWYSINVPEWKDLTSLILIVNK